MRIIVFLFALVFVQLISAQNSAEAVLPHYPDWMYQNRLEELDKKTSINLDYNSQVQAFIEVYTVKRRDHLANIIGLSEMYFPLFEEYLAKYDLPMELKYLAIVESALDPRAKSKSGAMGLWQFLYHASRMFDLKVDTYVDERCDPVKSTEAACKYLRYLYHNLNDWQLALAAYNGGIGVVQNAIERSGGKTDFWELQPYLPAAVKSYVPAFIAVNYVMNNYNKHEVEANPPKMNFNEIDTVFVSKSLTFQQVSDASGASMEMLRWLNPSFIKDYIPANDLPTRIFLPKANIVSFVKAEKNLENAGGPVVELIPVGDTNGREKIDHVVSKGEYFHKIAIDHYCRISDIMLWNNMKKRDLYVGQKLVIWQPKEEENYFFVVDEIMNPEKLNWKESFLATE
ncbi:transglycosylase SLT domain-containing protein [Carboxylicivirga caseinilyticus]|uniref:lytic transglycosylase domain-containing protein n=1 Tax=Carboxylicivirga caseinilyticus TaxID=3417572 RepID=UPI003D34992B|nr:transglycosylase SLT domain-containing protein [Marinilabiliaceae bacterium A049]